LHPNSKMQNNHMHWQAVIQCVYKLAGTIASYTLNHAGAIKPVHLYMHSSASTSQLQEAM